MLLSGIQTCTSIDTCLHDGGDVGLVVLIVIQLASSDQPDYPVVEAIGRLREVWLQTLVLFHRLQAPVKFGDMSQKLELWFVILSLIHI